MTQKSTSIRTKSKYNITVLQADVAYFDARLTLIRPKPKTNLEVAQKKVFRFLEQYFSQCLEKMVEHKKQQLQRAKEQRKKIENL